MSMCAGYKKTKQILDVPIECRQPDLIFREDHVLEKKHVPWGFMQKHTLLGSRSRGLLSPGVLNKFLSPSPGYDIEIVRIFLEQSVGLIRKDPRRVVDSLDEA